MKRIIKYIISSLILTAVIFSGCDNPAPTQLLSDEQEFNEKVDVEILSEDPSNPASLPGLDTAGVNKEFLKHTSVVAVSGIKITSAGNSEYASLGQAVFFDKSNPLFDTEGNLIGYKTLTPGIVSFNNYDAFKIQLRTRLRFHGGRQDTILGFQYLLYTRGKDNPGSFNFPYGKIIDFKLTPLIGNPIEFPISAPEEINARVETNGTRENKNFRARIIWNSSLLGKFEIVISAKRKLNGAEVPLYRLKTADDGVLIIPPKLLNEIPLDRFDGITFTLIRKFTKDFINGSSELFIISQSIHSIKISF